jgi:hypothetical protein
MRKGFLIFEEMRKYLTLFCAYANFYRAPAGCTAERKTESGQEERQKKRNMGLMYTVIWCAQTPPHHLFPILRVLLHLPAAMVIRAGGTVGSPPSPPSSPTWSHPISTVRGQWWISRTASDLEVVSIKTDIGQ